MTDDNSARARAGGGGPESSVRYQPDERPPEALAFGLGLQMAILQIAGIVLTPAIVIRAAGLGEPYLSWAVFAALIVCGLSTIPQSNRVGRVTLLEGGESDESGVRQLRLTARTGRRSAELEFVAAAGDMNIEDRMAMLGDRPEVPDESEISLRLLRHYASSVRHQKYPAWTS